MTTTVDLMYIVFKWWPVANIIYFSIVMQFKCLHVPSKTGLFLLLLMASNLNLNLWYWNMNWLRPSWSLCCSRAYNCSLKCICKGLVVRLQDQFKAIYRRIWNLLTARISVKQSFSIMKWLSSIGESFLLACHIRNYLTSHSCRSVRDISLHYKRSVR